MLVAKFLYSSNNEDQESPWSQNHWRKDVVASRENMITRAILSSITICVQQQLQQPLHYSRRPLK